MESWQLVQRQSLPLAIKIKMSERRIRDWYRHWEGQVYVSFSGGKDSTVLLHLIRSIYPNIPAVFINTGLQYPEIVSFVKSTSSVETLRPKMPFHQVLKKHGYPVISKKQAETINKLRNHNLSEKYRHYLLYGDERGNMGTLSKKWHFLLDAPFPISSKCCDVMKKEPFRKYAKKTGRVPFVGMMACESLYRKRSYLKTGCNAFNLKTPMSMPMAFWTDQDIWAYIKEFNVPYSKIYDMGEKQTGCIFCAFGAHLEKEPNRFQRMQNTHSKLWKYCMDGLGLRTVLDYIGVPIEEKQLSF